MLIGSLNGQIVAVIYLTVVVSMTEPVRLIGDPILTKPCPYVVIADHDIDSILLAMNESMLAANGIGLAANQIGYSLRIFILKNDDCTISEYINPIIMFAADQIQFNNEGCLSIPGVSTTTTRYNEVILSWIDKNGVSHSNTFKGLKAFAAQHEMEHLEGKLYIDQFGPIKRNLIVRKHKKFIKNSSSRR